MTKKTKALLVAQAKGKTLNGRNAAVLLTLEKAGKLTQEHRQRQIDSWLAREEGK